MLPSVANTTTTDPGIICFQHCTSKVFCFYLPPSCPTCKCKLVENDLKLLPFRLPYPFVKASQHPCAIVLRPTTGDFLNDYNNSKDLHIAVTTSRGIIVEFDQNGLRKTLDNKNSVNHSVWIQSLLVESIPEPWYDLWDNVLEQICSESNWSVDHYDEDKYNCYTFVLTFLKAICYDKLSQAAQSKTVFCEKYIVPRTTTAGKYISLYRKIRDQGIYTHPIRDLKLSCKGGCNCSNSSITNSHFKHQHFKTKNLTERNETKDGNGCMINRKLCTIEE